MIVTVFRSRLKAGLRDDYVGLVERMVELARSMPGYISHKGFFAEDGERCTIVEFESEETQRAWRMNPEHREAQRKGREIIMNPSARRFARLSGSPNSIGMPAMWRPNSSGLSLTLKPRGAKKRLQPSETHGKVHQP
jgi:heme-degrading monooxygenase HmoA